MFQAAVQAPRDIAHKFGLTQPPCWRATRWARTSSFNARDEFQV